jgi:hypothetical protein
MKGPSLRTNSQSPTFLLPDHLTLGEPDRSGALTVFPVLGRPGSLEYLSFAEASAHGCVVQELDPASVNDLLVSNPLGVPVLLYEGEEVQGAQQDRTVDLAVLVPAGARQRVAVSCVEAGRWDGSRRSEAFVPSSQTAFPELRAAKNRRMREALAASGEARADQAEVWRNVDAKAQLFEIDSDTSAMRDIYASRAERLEELEAGISRRDGQLGALAFVGDRPLVLDFVSRPDVFAALWQALLRGYCLDALSHEVAADLPDAGGWWEAIRRARPRQAPAPGLGRTLTFATRVTGGTGLAVDGELVQLTAFPANGDAHVRPGRIQRPSRRR